jgi:sugar phosphate isomerase/epimerase
MSYTNQIYISTVLLERNRWTTRQPSVVVSEWLDRFKEAGFDGVELWQNHALLASPQEQNRLRNSPIPIAIFNSYAGCGDEHAAERDASTGMAQSLSSTGMKFNFGRNGDQHSLYTQNVIAWRKAFPPSFRMLCECHRRTTMEDPKVAAETFERMAPHRIEAIVHAFGSDFAEVKRWFHCLGSRITHVHVQSSSESRRRVRLDRQPALVRERVRFLEDVGFKGSFTIEFTAGVTQPDKDEDIETTFQNAVVDLAFLRELLA